MKKIFAVLASAAAFLIPAATASAAPMPHQAVFIFGTQTCLPPSNFGGSIPAGDDECYVNAVVTSRYAYIHVTVPGARRLVVSYQYCVTFNPADTLGTHLARVRPPATIVLDPYCPATYGFPRGFVSAEVVIPARLANHARLWIASA